MVNKVAKGKQAERELAGLLESLGYETWRPSWNRYGSKDIFNIADIIAVRKKTGSAEPFGDLPPLFLIQVKTNRSDYYRARKQVKEFAENVDGEINLVVALKVRGKRYRMYIHGKEEFVYDFGKGEKLPINRRVVRRGG